MSARNLAGSGLGGRKIPQGMLDSMLAVLFGAGEQGVWYDPSDMATMFQDTAGTIPVTGVEQPVGRVLDKSGRGNHATQATAAKRPVLSARVNQMIGSEQWNRMTATDGSGTVTQELVDLPPFLAATSVSRVTQSSAGHVTFYHYVVNQPLTSGTINSRSFFFKPLPGCIGAGVSTQASDPFYFRYDFASRDTVLGVNVQSLRVEELEKGWFRFTVTQKAAATAALFIASALGVASAPNIGAAFLSTGYDSRPADQSGLPYQRVNTATDYDADPSKFPQYLKFDGADDALVVASIDFSMTDKINVFSGLRKAVDAAIGAVVELGPGTLPVGSFAVFAPFSGSPTYGNSVRGAAAAFGGSVTGFPAPITKVVASRFDLAGASGQTIILPIRVDGVPNNTAAAGTAGGTFGNYPLCVGARNQIAQYFNGSLYGLIVRGAASTPAQVAAAEHCLSLKTGVRLP